MSSFCLLFCIFFDRSFIFSLQDVDSAECIFEETLTENFFNVYYSAMYLHKRWCIGLRNNKQTRSFYRKPKPAKDTSFMIEIVQRRASTSSACDSDDSRVSSI